MSTDLVRQRSLATTREPEARSVALDYLATLAPGYVLLHRAGRLLVMKAPLFGRDRIEVVVPPAYLPPLRSPSAATVEPQARNVVVFEAHELRGTWRGPSHYAYAHGPVDLFGLIDELNAMLREASGG